MDLPNWLPAHGGITAFAFLAEFFMFGDELADTSDNVFELISNFIAFQVPGALPSWVGWSLFIGLSLPWLLIMAMFVIKLSETSLTGAFVLGIGISLTLIGFFT